MSKFNTHYFWYYEEISKVNLDGIVFLQFVRHFSIYFPYAFSANVKNRKMITSNSDRMNTILTKFLSKNRYRSRYNIYIHNDLTSVLVENLIPEKKNVIVKLLTHYRFA